MYHAASLPEWGSISIYFLTSLTFMIDWLFDRKYYPRFIIKRDPNAGVLNATKTIEPYNIPKIKQDNHNRGGNSTASWNGTKGTRESSASVCKSQC